ncbi:glycosyltransferase family 4 protein [Candidatus Omnitrophota bacterium]
MKVCHFISSGGFFGAENMIITLANEQLSAGADVCLGVFRNSQNPHLEISKAAASLNIPVKILECSGKFDLKAIFKIRDFIKKEDIEILHTHGYKANFYIFFSSFFLRAKRIATCHTWYSVNAKMKLYEWLDKLLLRRFDKITTVSEALKNEILGSGIAKDRISVINNGISLKGFEDPGDTAYLKNEFGLNENHKIIAVIARLARDKGHIYLLKAISKAIKAIPEISCLIIGDGQLRAQLELEARSLGLGNKVIFTGIRRDIPQLLSLTELIVMPSLKEGMPFAILEAMAAKKPIIASRAGAIPDMIEDGIDGLLVEPGDVDGLRIAIESLLKNQEKATLLARNGYEKIKSRFSSRKMAEDYIRVYQEALDGTVNTGQLAKG